MSSKRRQKPSLDGVMVKVERARFHYETLYNEVETLFERGAYVFVGEIHGDGREHIYRVKDAPSPDPRWSAIVGDCVHNLRSALDHLACQLVRANGGIPTDKTYFPIRRSRCLRNPSTGQLEPAPLYIAGGISTEAMEMIEAIQPYHGGNEGKRLLNINSLDVIDKHREIIVVAQAVREGVTSYLVGHPDAPPRNTIRFFGKPLVHDEKVAKVTYETPYSQLDPNLTFVPQVAFGNRGPLAREPVWWLGFFADWFRDELIPPFARFF
ncbi:MAG: hypothetical protein WAL35_02460 [Acidimicrobiales bacterium]